VKSTRQQEILDIIAACEVETQEQLLERLRERGISTTQATISRDIKQLHLVKELTAGGIYKYAVSHHRTAANFSSKLQTIFRECVTAFDVAQNIVVLKTLSGMANAAGAAIDHMDLPGLVGSLAGDDTAILIMRTNEAALEFCEEIREMLS
jgi:transcriptional regulator of arginine metabolism